MLEGNFEYSFFFREFYISFYEDEDKMSLELKEEFIMKFVKVDKLPGVKRNWHPLQSYIEEFMKMNTKVVLVELKPGEYSNLKVAQSTICSACKKSGYPVTCSKRNGQIYLVRKDME